MSLFTSMNNVGNDDDSKIKKVDNSKLNSIGTTIYNYIKKMKTNIVQNNLIVFFIIITIIQLVSDYVLLFIPTLILFQLPLVPGLYGYITGELNEYEYIGSAVISCVTTYIFYNIFITKSSSTIFKILFKAFTAFIILILMVMFSAVSASALSYTFVSMVLIPRLKFGYVYSYIGGVILSIILAKIFLYIKHNIIQPIFSTIINKK